MKIKVGTIWKLNEYEEKRKFLQDTQNLVETTRCWNASVDTGMQRMNTFKILARHNQDNREYVQYQYVELNGLSGIRTIEYILENSSPIE